MDMGQAVRTLYLFSESSMKGRLGRASKLKIA